MTRVKICGIRDATSAHAASAAGADALGFVFYDPSPRAVTVEAVSDVLNTLPPLITAVGLFVNPDSSDVERVLHACPLDLLQFHGSEDREFCESFGHPYIKAIAMGPDVDAVAAADEHPNARAVLLDSWQPGTPGGTGKTFDWTRIGELGRPWILAGGLTAENVADAIAEVKPPAVDVSGGVEQQRGVKDPERIEAFLDAVRSADGR